MTDFQLTVKELAAPKAAHRKQRDKRFAYLTVKEICQYIKKYRVVY